MRALRTPLLLITGARDQQLPPPTHVQPMRHLLPAQQPLPSRSPTPTTSASCRCAASGAIELLAESNEEFVCQEFGDRTRERIHAETLQAITTFLTAQGVL